MFQKASKQQLKLRLAIDGPSGSGKTYTALIAATVMAQGGKIAVIDTERGSASLYSDKFSFDVACLTNFHPQKYIDMIHEAEEAGYPVIVIDSFSHAWEGEGGTLDLVDQATARSRSKNSYFAWKDVTPVQRALVDAILQSPAHIIATMRSKTEYIVEEINQDGKKTQVPRKIGLAPIQRAGMEYEFTLVGDMDVDHKLIVSKSRCDAVSDAVVSKPDAKFFQKILDWLNSGAPATQPSMTPPGNNGSKAPTGQSTTPPPSNNGNKPKTNLDELGIQLWPGKWETVKPQLLGSFKNDQVKLLEFIQKRKGELNQPEILTSHIAKAWPGYERLIPGALQNLSEKFNPIGFVKGITNAIEVEDIQRKAGKELPDSFLVNIVITEAAIPEGF
jgi:hypothetical protein